MKKRIAYCNTQKKFIFTSTDFRNRGLVLLNVKCVEYLRQNGFCISPSYMPQQKLISHTYITWKKNYNFQDF